MVLISLLLTQNPIQDFVVKVQTAVDSKQQSQVRSLFHNANDADYLVEVLERETQKLKVIALDAPKGWGNEKWITISGEQELEQDHDPIYTLQDKGGKLGLGSEITEDFASEKARITHASIAVKLDLATKVANVAVDLKMDYSDNRAVVFRLNPSWQAPSFSEGELKRVGGLLIWTPTSKADSLSLTYGAKAGNGWVHFKDDYAYLLSYWIPSLGRLPHTTDTTIFGPKEWQLRSEGVVKTVDSESPVVKRVKPDPSLQSVRYECSIPISYPKVVSGAYTLVAEKKVGDRVFRSWMFGNGDKARAEFDVNRMAEFADFCDKNLMEWPFPGYECFDAKDFYGIESYSYTLLAPIITSRYVTHEMGHTYFGGIAPAAYVNDSWNEGVTTYLDDVLTGRLVDRPIEAGYETATYPKALDKMAVAHADNGISYHRGAYIMKMLEAEIGKGKVIEGLKLLLKGQVGLDTRWKDLRPYFEKAGNKPLDWFWKQWVESATFPKVKLNSSSIDRVNGRYRVRLGLSQTGTLQPYRIKLGITLDGGSLRVVEFKNATQTITIDGLTTKPTAVKIDPVGYTLAQVEGDLSVDGR